MLMGYMCRDKTSQHDVAIQLIDIVNDFRLVAAFSLDVPQIATSLDLRHEFNFDFMLKRIFRT